MVGLNIEQKTASGWRMHFSGRANEELNRQHYQNVASMVWENFSIRDINTKILACGAGFGAFYLAFYGVPGYIHGEDIDSKSIDVANFMQKALTDSKVRDTFLNIGLRKAYEQAESLFTDSSKLGLLHGLSFNQKDSTQTIEGEQKYSLIVCDFLHHIDIIGNESKMEDLLFRLDEISRPGTLLSYVYGSELDKIERLGFKPAGKPFLYKKE
jgi:hypothetical protein